MSQTFTDDCFSSAGVALTQLQQFENNFAALKSAFSGASTPANTVAGMPWLDTTNHIYRLRNEANNAWFTLWDMANNKPNIANIVSADFAAAMKDAAAATASLRTLGTSSTSACAGNDSRLSDSRTAPDASVSQSKLKTATVTSAISCNGLCGVTTLAGGEYGFDVQAKMSVITSLAAFVRGNVPFTVVNTDHVSVNDSAMNNIATSYTTYLSYATTNSSDTLTFQQRYVTSSGETNWLFIRRDKITKEIYERWFSSDHPRFHSGGSYRAGGADHPWMHMDLNALGQEVIVINPEQKLVESDLLDDEEADSWLDVFIKKYDIDDAKDAMWPAKPVTVALPKVLTDKNGNRRRVDDWRNQPIGMEVQPIKQVVPQPQNVLCKRLKLKK